MGEEYGRVSGYGGRVTSPIVDEDLAILGMVNSSWGDQAKGANRFVAFNKLHRRSRLVVRAGRVAGDLLLRPGRSPPSTASDC